MKYKTEWAILILNACTLIPALANFEQGLTAAKKGEYMLALKAWQPRAAEGHAASQYNLGLMYLHGLGVPADPNRAREWIDKAAAQGYAPAQKMLPILPDFPPQQRY